MLSWKNGQGSLRKHITTKPCVHHIVHHGHPCDWVAYFVQQSFPCFIDTKSINIFQHSRRRHKIQLRPRQLIGNSLEGRDLPFGIKIFVRNIFIIVAKRIEMMRSHWISSKVCRLRFQHFPGKGYCITHNSIRLRRSPRLSHIQSHEFTHGDYWSPTRKAVIADINNSTNPKPAINYINYKRPVFIRYPTPNTMQYYEIEFRKITASREIPKRLIEYMNIRLGCSSHSFRSGRVNRIEINAPIASLICGRMDVN